MLYGLYWAPRAAGFVSKFNKRRIIMISDCKKTLIKWVVIALSMTLLVGCSSIGSPINPTNSSKNQTSSITDIQSNTNPNSNSSLSSTTTDLSSIIYKNTQYGFKFTLPKSWQGFSIVSGNWQGNDIASGKATETGTMLSIRHPQWTTKNPRQDIPIFIFTLDQWNLLQKEKFHIGAAPIPPSELGRNNIYVFAFPARYNYAFPTGYKEVEQILNNHPLQPTQLPQSSDSMLLKDICNFPTNVPFL